MLATISSATLLGARGRPVTVEVHVTTGLPGFTVVGLPDETCRESRDRVRAALLSSGASWPNTRVTVNLAPSGLRKGGAGLDLPIALGLLVATQEVTAVAVEGLACVGELGLDGTVRRVPGIVPLAAEAAGSRLVVPADCVHEASLVAPGVVHGIANLRQLIEVLKGDAGWPPALAPPPRQPAEPPPDLADVRGQDLARGALEVVAAGGHHLLLSGPPGSGKSLLAHRLPGLLPPLDPATALEVTMVHSAAGISLPPGGLVERPPFRAPHHTASLVSMVGGGTANMRPGEVSAAHGGVLFLDELAEFDPSVLDGLREPLEEGVVRVARAKATAEFPARFVLVGAMNPCGCGMAARPGACRCSAAILARYARRLSGPLLDRFDLRVVVQRPGVDELLGPPTGEPTAVARGRVERARARAAQRGPWRSAQVPGHLLDEVAPITPAARAVLRRELESGRLTGRGLHRVRRVARTLADLDGGGDMVDDGAVNLALLMRVDPLDALRRETA
jgi:magnesium chelatase family protein